MLEEEKIDLGSRFVTAKQLEQILNDMYVKNKPSIDKWQKEMMAEHEDNYIQIKDYIAVLHIGFNKIGNCDGFNGYYDLTPEEYISWKQTIDSGFEPDESTFVTKQGLVKRYRFALAVDDLGDDPDEFRYEIVNVEKARRVIDSVQANRMSSLEMIMRRIGD